MIVVDASVIIEFLTDATGFQRRAQRALEQQPLAIPDAADLECVSVIRRLANSGLIETDAARDAVARLIQYPAERYPQTALLDRVWDLRENMWPYDAAYVALAEALDADLVTIDAKFQRTPGIRCRVRNLREEDLPPG